MFGHIFYILELIFIIFLEFMLLYGAYKCLKMKNVTYKLGDINAPDDIRTIEDKADEIVLDEGI